MSSVILDLVIVLVIAAYAIRGWHNGIVASALSLGGVAGGALLGLWAAPQLLALSPLRLAGLERTIALVAIVLLTIALADGALSAVGRRLRNRQGAALHAIDSVLGFIGAAVVAALVLGFLAAALKPIAPAPWVRTLDASRSNTIFNQVMPDEVGRAAANLTAILDAAGFPRVFSGLTREPELPVDAPEGAAASSDAVRAAATSVVKVTAPVPRCTLFGAQVGSGWVAAPERVVTNAHVVAGGEGLRVETVGGRPLPATLVAFSPDLDLAVLYVPGLAAAPLPRAGALERADEIAIAGFPGGGDYTVSSGRVRGTIDARGDDIYGETGVTRQVYSMRASVAQGNSGGPVLTHEGAVAGTLFAASLADDQTAYALTNAASHEVITAGTSATEAVSTGGCLR